MSTLPDAATDFACWAEEQPQRVSDALAALHSLREEIGKLPENQMSALADLINLLARTLIRNGDVNVGEKILS